MTTIGDDSTSVVLDLPVEPTSTVAQLRVRLAATLDDLGEDHRYDVLLVMTELVSNVLDHTAGTGRLRVLRSLAHCEITIEVDDTSELRPVHGRFRLGGMRGRGIVVIDKLAREWGTRSLADGGKTVFAAVGCPAGVTGTT
ncbi:ATP-binding protein [Lentzea sp. NPDC004789]